MANEKFSLDMINKAISNLYVKQNEQPRVTKMPYGGDLEFTTFASKNPERMMKIKSTKTKIMFTEDMVGSRILIKNRRNGANIRNNKTYKIVNYVNPNTVILDNTLGGYTSYMFLHDSDWERSSSKTKVFSVEIGKSYIICKKTQSYAAGDIKTVIDFVDGDSNKVILADTKPGGWIDSKNLAEIIDLSKYRLKTLREICADRGDLRIQNCVPRNILVENLGKTLAEVGVVQTFSTLVLAGASLHPSLITDEPVNKDLKLRLISEAEALKITSLDSKMRSMLGKTLVELGYEDTDEVFVKLLTASFNKGADSIKINGIYIYVDFFTFTPIEEKEEAKSETLPF